MPDYLAQGVVLSNGTALMEFSSNINGIIWEVEQISVMTGRVASATTASIFLNGNLVAPSSALTPLPVGQGTTAGGLPYLYIGPVDKVQIRVQGATAGDSVTLRAQYREWLSTDPEVKGR